MCSMRLMPDGYPKGGVIAELHVAAGKTQSPSGKEAARKNGGVGEGIYDVDQTAREILGQNAYAKSHWTANEQEYVVAVQECTSRCRAGAASITHTHTARWKNRSNYWARDDRSGEVWGFVKVFRDEFSKIHGDQRTS